MIFDLLGSRGEEDDCGVYEPSLMDHFEAAAQAAETHSPTTRLSIAPEYPSLDVIHDQLLDKILLHDQFHTFLQGAEPLAVDYVVRNLEWLLLFAVANDTEVSELAAMAQERLLLLNNNNNTSSASASSPVDAAADTAETLLSSSSTAIRRSSHSKKDKHRALKRLSSILGMLPKLVSAYTPETRERLHEASLQCFTTATIKTLGCMTYGVAVEVMCNERAHILFEMLATRHVQALQHATTGMSREASTASFGGSDARRTAHPQQHQLPRQYSFLVLRRMVAIYCLALRAYGALQQHCGGGGGDPSSPLPSFMRASNSETRTTARFGCEQQEIEGSDDDDDDAARGGPKEASDDDDDDDDGLLEDEEKRVVCRVLDCPLLRLCIGVIEVDSLIRNMLDVDFSLAVTAVPHEEEEANRNAEEQDEKSSKKKKNQGRNKWIFRDVYSVADAFIGAPIRHQLREVHAASPQLISTHNKHEIVFSAMESLLGAFSGLITAIPLGSQAGMSIKAAITCTLLHPCVLGTYIRRYVFSFANILPNSGDGQEEDSFAEEFQALEIGCHRTAEGKEQQQQQQKEEERMHLMQCNQMRRALTRRSFVTFLFSMAKRSVEAPMVATSPTSTMPGIGWKTPVQPPTAEEIDKIPTAAATSHNKAIGAFGPGGETSATCWFTDAAFEATVHLIECICGRSECVNTSTSSSAHQEATTPPPTTAAAAHNTDDNDDKNHRNDCWPTAARVLETAVERQLGRSTLSTAEPTTTEKQQPQTTTSALLLRLRSSRTCLKEDATTCLRLLQFYVEQHQLAWVDLQSGNPAIGALDAHPDKPSAPASSSLFTPLTVVTVEDIRRIEHHKSVLEERESRFARRFGKTLVQCGKLLRLLMLELAHTATPFSTVTQQLVRILELVWNSTKEHHWLSKKTAFRVYFILVKAHLLFQGYAVPAAARRKGIIGKGVPGEEEEEGVPGEEEERENDQGGQREEVASSSAAAAVVQATSYGNTGERCTFLVSISNPCCGLFMRFMCRDNEREEEDADDDDGDSPHKQKKKSSGEADGEDSAEDEDENEKEIGDVSVAEFQPMVVFLSTYGLDALQGRLEYLGGSKPGVTDDEPFCSTSIAGRGSSSRRRGKEPEDFDVVDGGQQELEASDRDSSASSVSKSDGAQDDGDVDVELEVVSSEFVHRSNDNNNNSGTSAEAAASGSSAINEGFDLFAATENEFRPITFGGTTASANSSSNSSGSSSGAMDIEHVDLFALQDTQHQQQQSAGNTGSGGCSGGNGGPNFETPKERFSPQF